MLDGGPTPDEGACADAGAAPLDDVDAGFGVCVAGAGFVTRGAVGVVGVSVCVLAIAGASPPVDGRDRLIRRQSPPSGAEGPDDPVDETRNVPEPTPHGCHPRGVDPRRPSGALPSVAEAEPGAVSAPGVNAPAELPDAIASDPPVPVGAPAALPVAPLESAVDASQSRQASVGDQVVHRRAA